MTSPLLFSTGTSGSFDKTVSIWDVSTQQQVAELRGHGDTVYSLAFDGSGKYLASGEVAEA
jgi:WD40 repeat protein